MNEQLKPLSKTENETIKSNTNESIINKIKLPELKSSEDIINNLPDWSIEPPLEIKRGNE